METNSLLYETKRIKKKTHGSMKFRYRSVWIDIGFLWIDTFLNASIKMILGIDNESLKIDKAVAWMDMDR